MSTPLKQVKYAALLACLAWALTLVVTTAAPAKDDHHGPDAAQHQQDKAAKDAEKAQKEAAKDAERAQKEAEHAQKEAAKDAEHAAKEAEKAAEKARKDAEKAQKEAAKKAKKHGKDAFVVVVSAPSVAPQQQIMGAALRPCASRRLVKVRVRPRRGVTFRSASFTLNGKRLGTRRGKRPAITLDLRGQAKGTYRLRIRVVTTKGRVLRGTRVYHTCVGPRPHRAPSL